MGDPLRDVEEFRVVHAIREAIPTRAHAEMLFGMILDQLGDLACVESWNDGAARSIFRRESPGSPWIVPWPVLSVVRGGREGPSPALTAIPGVYHEFEPRPGAAPKIRGLGPGSLAIHDGPHSVSVAYGKDGRWFECTRSAPPEAIEGVIPALASKSASPPELVANYLVGLDPARHGAARAYVPVALSGGTQSVWSCGLRAIREALFHGRVPADARWIAADGWRGQAIAFGATRDAAIAAWRDEVARLRPFPEKPRPPAEPLPEPSVEQSFDGERFSFRATLRGPTSDVPWVEPTVENSPAAVIPLGDLPASPPSLGSWTRLVGGAGSVTPAAIRHEEGGFVLIGDELLAAIGAERIDEWIAAADRTAPPRPEMPDDAPFQRPAVARRLRWYRLVDERTHAPVKPRVTSCSWSPDFHAWSLDGDQLQWLAIRLTTEQ